MIAIKDADKINEPSLAEIEQLDGPTMIEFGASWCGYCQAAHSDIELSLAKFPLIRHIKVEDGKGRRLGRTYSVTLWPTLIFLSNGKEISRLVRPVGVEVITKALAEVNPPAI